MSETACCRLRLAPFCLGYGVDLGFGGDPITDHAIRVDMQKPYTSVGTLPVQLGGDASQLVWFNSGVLDFVYSSHLLEDFIDTRGVLTEWLRVLRPGGNLILYCPHEQRFRTHCKVTGQPYNQAHKHHDFSFSFVRDVLAQLGQTLIIHSAEAVEVYSWELVCKKQ